MNTANDSVRFGRMTALWTRVQPTVAAYIASFINSVHDAEEVQQEVALGIVQSYDRYDPSMSEVGWVLGIARHKVTDYLRKRNRSQVVIDPQALSCVAAAFEELQPEVSERRAALRDCMQLLKQRARQVVQLHYEDGLKATEIGEKLAMQPNAVWVTLHRVRNTLVECVRRKLERGHL